MSRADATDVPARSARWQWLVLLLAIVALAGMWRWTPLATWVDPGALVARAAPLRHSALAPLVVVAVYLIASLLVAPIVALMVATGMLFGPLRGAVYSMAGIMLSAAANYAIGRWLGRGGLRRLKSPRLDALNRSLARRGMLAVATLRIVPLAPFTVVNVVAGAASIPLWDFLLGTLIGTLPGTVIISLFAGQLHRTVRDADPRNIAALVAIVAAAIAASLGLRRYLRSRAG